MGCNNYATISSANVVSGGSAGNFNYQAYGSLSGGPPLRIDSDTFIKIDRMIGSQGSLGSVTNYTPGTGDLCYTKFTVSTRTWGPTTPFYTADSGLNIPCAFATILPGEEFIRCYFIERVSGAEGSLVPVYLIKSTDLTGTTWGSRSVAMPSMNNRDMGGVVFSQDRRTVYLLLCSGVSPTRVWLIQSTDGGETFTSGPKISSGGTFSESSILSLNDGRMIAFLRDENGGEVYQRVSSNWGATWSTTIGTGLGYTDSDPHGSDNTKVTPKILWAAGSSSHVLAYYYDRGEARLKISQPVSKDEAFVGNWGGIYKIGQSSYGNGNIVVIDDDQKHYLCYDLNNEADQGEYNWWIWKDICLGTTTPSPHLVAKSKIDGG